MSVWLTMAGIMLSQKKGAGKRLPRKHASQNGAELSACIWAVGPSALPCAGAAPPQRPPRLATLLTLPQHSLYQRVSPFPPTTHLNQFAHPSRKGPVGAGLVPALCSSKSRNRISPTIAAHSTSDPFAPRTGMHSRESAQACVECERPLKRRHRGRWTDSIDRIQ